MFVHTPNALFTCPVCESLMQCFTWIDFIYNIFIRFPETYEHNIIIVSKCSTKNLPMYVQTNHVFQNKIAPGISRKSFEKNFFCEQPFKDPIKFYEFEVTVGSSFHARLRLQAWRNFYTHASCLSITKVIPVASVLKGIAPSVAKIVTLTVDIAMFR